MHTYVECLRVSNSTWLRDVVVDALALNACLINSASLEAPKP